MLGAEIRTGDRATVTPASSTDEQSPHLDEMVVRIADSVDADDALLAGAVSDHQPGAGQLLLAEHMPIGERDPKSGALDLDAVNADLRDNKWPVLWRCR